MRFAPKRLLQFESGELTSGELSPNSGLSIITLFPRVKTAKVNMLGGSGFTFGKAF
jgi:hypothetical protein